MKKMFMMILVVVFMFALSGCSKFQNNEVLPGSDQATNEITSTELDVTPEIITTPMPTVEPTPVPTVEPTPVPTVEPTPVPTVEPTPVPAPEDEDIPAGDPWCGDDFSEEDSWSAGDF